MEFIKELSMETIKVFQLSDEYYQAKVDNITYVGSIETIKKAFIDNGYLFSLSADIVPFEPKEYTTTLCVHSWKRYEGIYRVFNFCEICDAKQEL